MLSSHIAVSSNGEENRLILHHITVKDFKSYSGTHTIGPFHHSFTSIVGPNGSGKSNVIDSLLFVLGYRAKRMRQGKLSELIHHSEGVPEADSTTVSLGFEWVDSQGTVINGKGFSVARTVHKSNRSTYTLNNEPARFEQVEELLKGLGIDLDHERFLILQGEVESIALMKPKGVAESEEGLLEYLEDIIGSNALIPQIIETGKSVDKLNEECSEKLLRLRVCEKNVSALEPEKQEADEYLRKENELTASKAQLYSVLRFQSNKLLKEATATLQQAQSTLEKEQKKCEKQVEETAHLEDELKVHLSKFALIEKEAESALKKLSVIEQEDIRLQETRKHLKNKLKALSKVSDEDNKVRADIERQVSNLENEANTLLNELTSMEVTLKKSESELQAAAEDLKGKTGALQEQKDKIQLQLRNPMEKQRKIQASIDLEAAAIESLRVKLNEEDTKLQDLKNSFEACKAKLASAEEEKAELIESQNEAARGIGRCDSEVKQTETQLARVNKDIAGLEQTVNEANHVLNEAATEDSLLAALLRESSQNRIKGIHGRLGDLGGIEDTFDVAISTCCPALNNIVVETTAVAQQCIEFLRTNRLGRASFIILDKMKPISGCDVPKGARRLFDLVQCKEKYRTAFYFALGDTLVAQNLDEATKFAYNSGPRRFRVVTLDGKLIDVAGTMSGGGGKPKKGAMKRSTITPEVSREQVQQLEGILSAKRQEASQLRSKLAKVQEQQHMFERQHSDAEFMLTKIEITITSLKNQITGLEEQLKIASQSTTSEKDQAEFVKQIERHEKEVTKLQKELEKVKATMEPLEKQLAQLDEQLMQAGGLSYRSMLTRVQGQKDQMSLKKNRLAKIDAEMQAATRRLQDLSNNSNKSSTIKEADKLQEEIKAIEAQIQQKTIEASSIQKQSEKLSQELEDNREIVDSVKEKLNDLGKTLSKYRKLEFELKSKVEEQELRVQEQQATINKCAKALEGLKMNAVNGETPIIPVFDDERELARYKEQEIQQLKRSVEESEARLGMLNPNLGVILEYNKAYEEFTSSKTEFEDTERRRNESRKQLEDLNKQRYDDFMLGLRTISGHLKEIYQLITLGGNAELELVDSLDPFSEGILFSVMPPRKSWKAIGNLSGGEKTLSSLALVFALHVYRPTPVYVMDEIDAALDFRNVSIIANYIRERTKNAQFIVISLRSNMFELSDRLVGIYKTEQRTKSVTINNSQGTACSAVKVINATTASTACVCLGLAKYMQNMNNSSNAPPVQHQQKIEMIKQYYNQLSSNIKNLAAQLALPDLALNRRMALQQQYDRLQASMVEFTDKVLKPLMSGGGAGTAGLPRPSIPTGSSVTASPSKRKISGPTPIVSGTTGGFQAAQQQQYMFQQRMLALNSSSNSNTNSSGNKKPQATAPISKIKSLLQPDLPKLISESMSLTDDTSDLDAFIGDQDSLVDWILCDTMIDQVCEEACRAALLRQSDTVTSRDLAFALRRVYPTSPLLGRNNSLIPVKRLPANHPHTLRLAQMKRLQQRLLSNTTSTNMADNPSNQ